MRRKLASIVLASTLVTGCMGPRPMKMSTPTIALLGSGFAMMVAGIVVYQVGRDRCREMELPLDDCSADDTHNLLALIFVAGGLATASVGGIVMTRK